jgi:cyclic pyranopterin phosphate synthase
MLDPFGRRVTYLRVSVTDRCDLRCVYCMAETMQFLPKADVLTLEEMERLCAAFVARGVRKIRLTGGEPLVRPNILTLIGGLGRLIGPGGLDELTLTTNGTQLARHAGSLAAAGIRRINVSLDSLDGDRFAAVTRGGSIARVLDGLMAAKAAGLAVKINTVALKGVNDDEYDRLVEWCGSHGFDLCLIETMPMGEVHADRTEQYLPLSQVHRQLGQRWTLQESDWRTGGPARYWTVAETGRRVGFITPMSHNFCESCNRVRVTCTGTLYTCLGQDDAHDLRAPLRAGADGAALAAAIDAAIARKPKGHDFIIDRAARPGSVRHMSVTGG